MSRGGLRITMVLPTLARAGMETVTARLAIDLKKHESRVLADPALVFSVA